MALEQILIHKKMNLNQVSPLNRINLKLILDLSVESKATKVLEESIGENLLTK